MTKYRSLTPTAYLFTYYAYGQSAVERQISFYDCK